MAYVKQIWKDYPDTTTLITAERLNHMEDGIEAASGGESANHIFYKTENTSGKYYKIYEYTDNQYSYFIRPIVIRGTCGYFGNTYKKNFDIFFDLRGAGAASTGNAIPVYGVVSNKDYENSTYPYHVDIVATYNNGTVRIYVYFKSKYSYIDATVEAERGTVYTDSSATDSMQGTVKSRMSNLITVADKQDKFEIDNDGYITL